MKESVMTRRQLDARLGASVKASLMARGFDRGSADFGPVAAQVAKPRPKGDVVARMVRALAANRGVPELAAKWVMERFNDTLVAKALSASIGATGGFLVPEQFATEVIELLRPASVVLSLNPMMIDMPHGNITLPAVAGGAIADYGAEQTNAVATNVTVRQIRMSARKMTALVPISNDILRFSSVAADAIVREDVVRAIAQRADLAFIRGDGSGNSPRGLRYLAPASNVIQAPALTGTLVTDLQNVTQALGKLELALMAANAPMSRPGWIMAPRTMVYLQNLRDLNGNLVYSDEMSRGTLRGKPFRRTTLIPTNLDASGVNSEIYLADFADVVIAEAGSLLIDVSDTAAYNDGSQLQAPYSRDEAVVRAIVQHDIAMRHDPSVAVMTGVNWQ